MRNIHKVFFQDLGRYITENNLKLNLDHFDFLLDPPLKRIRNIWRELKKSGKAEIKVTAVDAPAANDKAIADVAADEKSSVRLSVEESKEEDEHKILSPAKKRGCVRSD